MNWLVSITFLAATAATLLLAPVYIRSAFNKGVTARDSNKKRRPVVANMGGFTILTGLSAAVSLAILLMALGPYDDALFTSLLAAFASITMAALIGVFDDLFKLSRKTKPFLIAAAALPLVAITAGNTQMVLPFVGSVDFGLFYALALIPLGVTGAANALNMSAGYNGLEAGIGVVVSLALLPIAVYSNAFASAILLAALLGSCLAFLKYNWFPARAFPGDIGTYVIGTTVAAAAILGNMESFAVIAILPAFYELVATAHYSLKGVERRQKCQNPRVLRNGVLKPVKGAEKYTLFNLLLSRFRLTEKKLVLVSLSLYAACGLSALAIYFYRV
jgi:UDP-N-acetylglucosamine--dolichyl-phosphate N-acetylglucosaminephosphotransferase